MERARILTALRKDRAAIHLQGFSLLEMMMVLTLILLAASITQPIYQNMMLRAREAALRDTPGTPTETIGLSTVRRLRPSPGPVA